MVKKHGYWKNWENTKVELERVISTVGHFPTNKDFEDTHNTALASAINRHHNGLLETRIKMGYAQVRKPHRYWKNRENVENEILALRISEAGVSQTPDRYQKLIEEEKKNQEKEARIAELIRQRYSGRYQTEEEAQLEEEEFQKKLEVIRNG